MNVGKITTDDLYKKGIVMFLFGPFSLFLSKYLYFGRSSVQLYISGIGIFAFVLLWLTKCRGLKIRLSYFDVFYMLLLLVFFRKNALLKAAISNHYVFYFVSMFFIAYVLKFSTVWFESIPNFLRYASLIAVFSTIMLRTPEGLYSHYSANGYMLSTAIVVYFAYFITHRHCKFDLVMLILSALALIITTKRGPLIAVVAAVFTIYMCYNSDKKMQRWMRIVICIFLLIPVVGFLSNFVPEIQQLIARFTISGDTNTFLSGREVIYLLAWELFLDNPILGTGWYTFPQLTSGLLAVDIDAHNIYLQLLCETGIIGFSIFASWFVINLYKAIEMLCGSRRGKKDYKQYEYALCFSIGFQVFFLVYGMSGSPLYVNQLMIIYIVAGMIPNTINFLLRNCKKGVVLN